MTFIIDLDDTLIKTKDALCQICNNPKKILEAIPIQMEINLVNEAYNRGHIIIIHTARGWSQYDITIQQLKNYKIKYHHIVMGKPAGIYIDADCHKSIKEVIC